MSLGKKKRRICCGSFPNLFCPSFLSPFPPLCPIRLSYLEGGRNGLGEQRERRRVWRNEAAGQRGRRMRRSKRRLVRALMIERSHYIRTSFWGGKDWGDPCIHVTLIHVIKGIFRGGMCFVPCASKKEGQSEACQLLFTQCWTTFCPLLKRMSDTISPAHLSLPTEHVYDARRAGGL